MGRPDKRMVLNDKAAVTFFRVNGVIVTLFGLVLWLSDVMGVQNPTAGQLIAAVGVFTSFGIPALFQKARRDQDRPGK